MIRNILIGTALATLAMNPALAQEINVKLGVLNDRSGVYADLSGEGSVIAAQMAIDSLQVPVLDIPNLGIASLEVRRFVMR